ncbi:membrane protein [Bacteroidia bacterium]|nr:membrane protein [Bacteroidia bacterium]
MKRIYNNTKNILKNNHSFLAVLTLALAAGSFSCSDSLDVVPIGKLMSGNFPVTNEDAVAIVNGVYQPNVSISTSLGYMIDLTSELEQNGENPNSGGGLLGVLSIEPTNSYNESTYTALFRGISRANDAIDKITASTTISPTIKQRTIGEAQFLRAYYYQYAVQFWGDVPLVLHNVDGTNTTRASVDEVFTQIVQDLQDAASNLPSVKEYSSVDKGRATKGAALAFLSKVYLVWGQLSDTGGDTAKKDKFRKSVEAANQVTDYQLEEEYLNNWSNSNRNGKENIFATQHAQNQADDGSGGNHLVHCSFSSGFSQSLPHVAPSSSKFYEEFDNDDQRKEGTYVKVLYNPATGEDYTFDLPRYRKYIDITDASRSASNRNIDRTVIRYAEVLLIKAEALNELNNAPNAEAYDAINQVRRRAFKHFPVTAGPTAHDIIPGLNYEDFKKALQQERVFELTYEQTRRLDLVRWRIYVKTLKESGIPAKQSVELKHYRFPIPQTQREINPDGLWQNWGYDGYDPAKTGQNPYAGFE